MELQRTAECSCSGLVVIVVLIVLGHTCSKQLVVLGSVGGVLMNKTSQTTVECHDLQLKYYRRRGNYWRWWGDGGLNRWMIRVLDSWPNPCAQPNRHVAVIDIGVHDGMELPLYLRTFGHQAGCTNSTLFAFEPNPNTKLRTLLQHSGSDLKFMQMALSHENGSRLFFGDGHTGSLVKSKSKFQQGRSTRKVKVETLMGALQPFGIQRIPLMKIDAENSDGNIIFGARPLFSIIDVMVFECNRVCSPLPMKPVSASRPLRGCLDLLMHT